MVWYLGLLGRSLNISLFMKYIYIHIFTLVGALYESGRQPSDMREEESYLGLLSCKLLWTLSPPFWSAPPSRKVFSQFCGETTPSNDPDTAQAQIQLREHIFFFEGTKQVRVSLATEPGQRKELDNLVPPLTPAYRLHSPSWFCDKSLFFLKNNWFVFSCLSGSSQYSWYRVQA